MKYWLGNRQPDRWRDQPETDSSGHDDALDRLIKAQDEALAGGCCCQAMKEEHGKALPADLERFILLTELSGGGWKRRRDGAGLFSLGETL